MVLPHKLDRARDCSPWLGGVTVLAPWLGGAACCVQQLGRIICSAVLLGGVEGWAPWLASARGWALRLLSVTLWGPLLCRTFGRGCWLSSLPKWDVGCSFWVSVARLPRGVGLEVILSSRLGICFPSGWGCRMGSMSSMANWLGMQTNPVPWPDGATGSADEQNCWLGSLLRCCCEQAHYPPRSKCWLL